MKILVGYDGSNTAKDALSLAKTHAKAFDAKVHVTRCITQTHEVKPEDMDKMDRADQELARICKKLNEENIPCEARLLVSDLSPGERLVEYAKETGANYIIVGVRRRSKVGKLLFGSTAQFVILEAPCPVITVK